MTERPPTVTGRCGALSAGRLGRAGAAPERRPALSSCPVRGTADRRPPDLGEIRPLQGPKSSKISPVVRTEGLR